MARVLVLGATGFIGRRLIPGLIAHHHNVRAAVRRTTDNPALIGTEMVRADVFDGQSLAAAMDDIEAVYYLVHSMGEKGRFEDADRRAAENVASAAKTAGVKRIIYLGGLGEGRDLSPHLASRAEVGRTLGATGVPVTVLRAAIILGHGGASYEMLRHLVERLPVMVTPRWVKTRAQPIAVRDVIAYLIGALEDERTAGRTYDIGGPDVLSYLDMMKRFAAVEGKQRLVIGVPVLTPKLSSYWVNLVTPVKASIAQPLIEGLRNEVVVKDDSIRDLVPVSPTHYEDAVMESLIEALPDRLASGKVIGIVPAVANEAFDLAYDAGQPGVAFEARAVRSSAPPEALWSEVEAIGGDNGWYYQDWLWTLRGWIDGLAGGVGNRRGRSERLAAGDPLDSWVVERIVPCKDLQLRSGMRMPKLARMGLHVRPWEGGSVLIQWVEFHPNVVTWFYWWAAYFLHRLVFRGLVREVVRRSENSAGGEALAHA